MRCCQGSVLLRVGMIEGPLQPFSLLWLLTRYADSGLSIRVSTFDHPVEYNMRTACVLIASSMGYIQGQMVDRQAEKPYGHE